MIAAQNHPLVDVFSAGDSFSKHIKSFIEHCAENPVDRESRRLVHDDDVLSNTLSPFLCDRQSLVRCLITPDDLQKLHHRNRVEEMRSDKFLWTLGRCCE